MTIRFFILSAHYRGTVDFSNDALTASQKGLTKLMDGISDMQRINTAENSDSNVHDFIASLRQKCYDAMNDDLQTPLVISTLFEACHIINTIVDHKANICEEDLNELKSVMELFAFDILGLRAENNATDGRREEAFGKVVDMVLELRKKARSEKNWTVCDQIRDALNAAGFEVKDTKDGCIWKLNC